MLSYQTMLKTITFVTGSAYLSSDNLHKLSRELTKDPIQKVEAWCKINAKQEQDRTRRGQLHGRLPRLQQACRANKPKTNYRTQYPLEKDQCDAIMINCDDPLPSCISASNKSTTRKKSVTFLPTPEYVSKGKPAKVSSFRDVMASTPAHDSESVYDGDISFSVSQMCPEDGDQSAADEEIGRAERPVLHGRLTSRAALSGQQTLPGLSDRLNSTLTVERLKMMSHKAFQDLLKVEKVRARQLIRQSAKNKDSRHGKLFCHQNNGCHFIFL